MPGLRVRENKRNVLSSSASIPLLCSKLSRCSFGTLFPLNKVLPSLFPLNKVLPSPISFANAHSREHCDELLRGV